MESDILFDEARRLRKVAATLPYYKASSYENRAREVDNQAWRLRQQEIAALMRK